MNWSVFNHTHTHTHINIRSTFHICIPSCCYGKSTPWNCYRTSISSFICIRKVEICCARYIWALMRCSPLCEYRSPRLLGTVPIHVYFTRSTAYMNDFESTNTQHTSLFLVHRTKYTKSTIATWKFSRTIFVIALSHVQTYTTVFELC